MTARPLAPEADLATVLQLATDALQRGVMLDPEELLCQLLGLNPAQLLAHLEEEETPSSAAPDRSPADSRARARENPLQRTAAGWWVRHANSRGPAHLVTEAPVLLPATLCGRPADPMYPWVPAEVFVQICTTCSATANAERAVWRQAEAGTVQHLVLHGRALCAADDAGPWRAVAGVTACAACTELEEVLGRHG